MSSGTCILWHMEREEQVTALGLILLPVGLPFCVDTGLKICFLFKLV